MCLSTVYKLGESGPEALCSDVSSFSVTDDGIITFIDLLGLETRVAGRIEKVDFVESKIYLADCVS